MTLRVTRRVKVKRIGVFEKFHNYKIILNKVIRDAVNSNVMANVEFNWNRISN